MEEIKGNIHSIETFGTLDGPGVRFVVFLRGCPMRCLYCHNPDTWSNDKALEMTVEDILSRYDGVKEFLRNGGLTVSGGEPLVQINFVTELFKRAKEKNIHTALDTSGILFDKSAKYDELIKYTNLVLLDIKHIDDNEHKKLTGHSNKSVLEFAEYLSNNNIPMWIRHVAVPEITFKEEYLKGLGRFISTLKTVKVLDILPYHDMAKEKYKQLNIKYPLSDIKPLPREETVRAKGIIMTALR